VILPVLALLVVAQPPVRSGAARPAAAAPAPAPEGTLLVGSRGVERQVLLLEEREGARVSRWVRADQLASAAGGSLTEDGIGRWRLRLPGVSLVVREGVPFAVSSDGDAHELPLLLAPQVEGDRLWLPFQLVSDVLPRLSATLTYDPARRALTLGRGRPAAPRTAAAPAPAPLPAVDSGRAEPTRLPTIIGPRRSAPAPVAPARSEPPVASAPPPERPVPGGELARHTVVVDAGHGGPDAGMRGPIGGGTPILEKNVTLAVAHQLRAALRERGVGVALTRTTDTLIALADRGKIAAQRSGDLFISIHVNAANPAWRNPAATRGFETYFLSEARTADDRRVADRENESVRFEGASAGGASDPVSFIMRDMAQNEHLRESSALAATVQRRLGQVHPGPSRGVRQAGFRVLVSAFMPAVLVEIGFGSNPEDAAWISSPRGQREIADAVADAAVEYLRRYEQRTRSGARP
jgi:N-acetylmuramoyl-L-alanine amidase